LIVARKLALLFGFNHGVRPFYAACRFDELSRGSGSCLSNASFKKRFHNATTQFFTPESMAMASAEAIQVASRVALDLLYWAMRSAPYHLIRMAIEMARKAGAFFSVVNQMS
jgi:hypothetical protein